MRHSISGPIYVTEICSGYSGELSEAHGGSRRGREKERDRERGGERDTRRIRGGSVGRLTLLKYRGSRDTCMCVCTRSCVRWCRRVDAHTYRVIHACICVTNRSRAGQCLASCLPSGGYSIHVHLRRGYLFQPRYIQARVSSVPAHARMHARTYVGTCARIRAALPRGKSTRDIRERARSTMP